MNTNQNPLPKITAIIPAAGIGQRMGSIIPKQYIKVQDKTILEHTVSALQTVKSVTDIVIAVANEDEWIKESILVNQNNVHLVTGGKERYLSVLSALQFAQQHLNSEWVLVHDAARPLVNSELIDKLINSVDFASYPNDLYAGALLAIPIKDTLKEGHQTEVGTVTSKTISRAKLWAAQTPQFYPVELLIKAIEMCKIDGQFITDEASAIEYIGLSSKLILGDASNIKLTEPSDLAFIEFMIAKKNSESSGLL